MKKNLLLIPFLIFSLLPCFAGGRSEKESAPLWLTDTEKEFPSGKYIRALGEGSSAKLAQSEALSTISLYFDTKTDILTLAVKEAQSILSGDSEMFSSSQGFTQMVEVSSSADFFCVSFVDSYYDKQRDKFHTLAYIDKAKVSSIYSSRISFLMDSINSYRNLSKRETELFRAAGYMHKAEVLSKLASQYIQNLVTINPDAAPKYSESLAVIAKVPEELGAFKKDMSFDIRMAQTEKRYDPIFSTVANILEQQGFTFSVTNPKYVIVISISCVEETYDVGEFVRSSIELLITNQETESVYSYSKAYPRVSGKDLSQSYTRALFSIQKDLEENLLSEYR